MKYILFFAVSLTCATGLFAQTAPGRYSRLAVKNSEHFHLIHQYMLRGLLNGNKQPAEAKMTSGLSLERVIAQSTRDNTANTLNDSISLKYGINRGSGYDYSNMIYAYNYPYFTSPMFNYAGVFTRPKVLFDTFRHWTVDPNTLVYGFYESGYAGYDANENTTTYKQRYSDSAISPNMNFTNRFNGAGNIDSAYAFNWISGLSDSAFRQFFSYNTMNELIKDSTYEYHAGSWHMVSKSIYTYNLSNDLIQIDNYANTTDTTFTLPLTEQLQYINTYDGSHRLYTVASSYYNGTTFGPYVIDTFGYTGAYSFHTSWKEYQYDPINVYWAPILYMTKILNISGLPDTVNINSYDSVLHSWIPQTMDVVHYNTNHDPDTIRDYEYNFTSFPATPSFTTIYYYQVFINSLGEYLAVKPTEETLIYPNPATDYLNVGRLPVQAGNQLQIGIINASGQPVLLETITWQGMYRLAISGLTPGIYRLLISDRSGNMVHQQAIIKQ